MLNFIVLGILPGTSLIITLTWVLVTVLLLIISSLVWYELRHAKKSDKNSRATKINFKKVSTN